MADHDGHTIDVGPLTVGEPTLPAVADLIDTDHVRDEINHCDPWQWRAWVEDLLLEVDRLRGVRDAARRLDHALGGDEDEILDARDALRQADHG